MPNKFPRYTESQIRQLLQVLGAPDANPDDIAARLEQLRHNLAPEDEISLILSWLGRCRIVHKLGQEQLPVISADSYRVPDLLAVFDVGNKLIPVLIEVKKSKPAKLKIHPGYVRYAELVGLPLLVAWQSQTFWILFDVHEATAPDGNYRIDFSRAMENNLLMLLAGDFSYSIAPGTTFCMRIKKLSTPDAKRRFVGEIEETYFVNPAGERIPGIPHLFSLLLFCETEVTRADEGDAIVQSFVVPDAENSEFASRTLDMLLRSSSPPEEGDINLRKVMHDLIHWVHNSGEFHKAVEQGVKCGIFTDIRRARPRNLPAFLKDVEDRGVSYLYDSRIRG